jgi:hypothetical protein
MRNRVSICTLIIGLICPFTQAARGQHSGPVQRPPATSSYLEKKIDRMTSETFDVGKRAHSELARTSDL